VRHRVLVYSARVNAARVTLARVTLATVTLKIPRRVVPMPIKPQLRRAAWTALIAALGASGLVGAAPEHGQAFEDWTARCEKPAGAAVERCYIFQNLVLKETGERLLHMAVGHLAADGQTAAVVTLPLGISLPPGAAISVDGGEPVRFQVERCDASGCVGAIALEPDMLAALKRGREARITFHDGTRRPIAVPVSLMGFTAGFESLDP